MLTTSSIAAICVIGDTLTKIAIDTVNKKMRFGMTGPSSSWQNMSPLVNPKTILLHPDAQSALQALVPLISVFARHAPRQKEAVIAPFNGAGRITLMCFCLLRCNSWSTSFVSWQLHSSRNATSIPSTHLWSQMDISTKTSWTLQHLSWPNWQQSIHLLWTTLGVHLWKIWGRINWWSELFK